MRPVWKQYTTQPNLPATATRPDVQLETSASLALLVRGSVKKIEIHIFILANALMQKQLSSFARINCIYTGSICWYSYVWKAFPMKTKPEGVQNSDISHLSI